jgi:hypothetical protein
MIRSAIAALLALVLAQPAPAVEAEDVAKIAAGLAALYLLGQAIERQGRDDIRPGRDVVARAPAPVDPLHRSDRPRRRPAAQDIRLLPPTCRRDFEVAGDVLEGFDAACLQNRVARPGSLPPDCLRRVATSDGPRMIYGPHCLRAAGWSPRTARR